MNLGLVLPAVILLSLAFDYVNGFHDSANAIATAVSTRAVSPTVAVVAAGLLNFGGAFISQGVAETISSGLVDKSLINDQTIILAALVGAIFWNLATWWWGLPSSSTHALIGGLVGAAVFSRGVNAVYWNAVSAKVVIPAVTSPLAGLAIGFLFTVLLFWLFRRALPQGMMNRFRRLQMLSCSLLALSHGTNDAQKTMGIITLALVVAGRQTDFHVQWWVKCLCATFMGLGTAAGGWRIIKTLGMKMTRLDPIHGFAAEATAASVLFTSAFMGMPVSTTHVISGAVMGVGAAKRVKAVRWSVAKSMVTAWILTLPAAACAAGVTMFVLRVLVRA